MNGAPIPLWVVALFLAVLAPFTARMLATMFERRARQKSSRLLASTFERFERFDKRE